VKCAFIEGASIRVVSSPSSPSSNLYCQHVTSEDSSSADSSKIDERGVDTTKKPNLSWKTTIQKFRHEKAVHIFTQVRRKLHLHCNISAVAVFKIKSKILAENAFVSA
jgi:hypothetical protein